MKTKLIFIFLFSILFSSCGVDRCDVDCDSGPIFLDCELVDKDSGENLFSNGFLNLEDIQVLDIDAGNSLVSFDFISEDELNLLRLGPFGWDVKIANYRIETDSLQLFKFYIDAEAITEGCCSIVKTKRLRITGSEFELDENSGTYKILIKIE